MIGRDSRTGHPSARTVRRDRRSCDPNRQPPTELTGVPVGRRAGLPNGGAGAVERATTANACRSRTHEWVDGFRTCHVNRASTSDSGRRAHRRNI